jgi:hypothetical protein
MPDSKRIKLKELREPGTQRATDAMQKIEEEAPGLLDEAVLAAAALKKNRGDGGRIPQ